VAEGCTFACMISHPDLLRQFYCIGGIACLSALALLKPPVPYVAASGSLLSGSDLRPYVTASRRRAYQPCRGMPAVFRGGLTSR
jgi:hypothetical protein